jgi:hypothetical protein
MKIFSVKAGPLGERLVTGSTAASLPLGTNAPLGAPLGGGSPFSSGLAVSVLPMEYQRRLLSGGQISVEEFSTLNLSVVK